MSEGGEVDAIGQSLGRTSAALLSTALLTAREVMRRNAEHAEQARRQGELNARDEARQLEAKRELAAVQWRRVNLGAWFRESPQEVAEVWASAAAWAPYDERAREALNSLNRNLDHYGVMASEIAETVRETADHPALAELLRRGAEEARRRLEQASPSADNNHAEHVPAAGSAASPGTAQTAGQQDTGQPHTTPTTQPEPSPAAQAQPAPTTARQTPEPPGLLDYTILVDSGAGQQPDIWVARAGTAADVVSQLQQLAGAGQQPDPQARLEYRVTLTPRDGTPPFALNGACQAPQAGGILRSIAGQIDHKYGQLVRNSSEAAEPVPEQRAAQEPAREARKEPEPRPDQTSATVNAASPDDSALDHSPEHSAGQPVAEPARVHCQIVVAPTNGELATLYEGVTTAEEVAQWLDWTASRAERGELATTDTDYTYDVRTVLEDGQYPAAFASEGHPHTVAEHLRWIRDWVQQQEGYGQFTSGTAEATAQLAQEPARDNAQQVTPATIELNGTPSAEQIQEWFKHNPESTAEALIKYAKGHGMNELHVARMIRDRDNDIYAGLARVLADAEKRRTNGASAATKIYSDGVNPAQLAGMSFAGTTKDRFNQAASREPASRLGRVADRAARLVRGDERGR